MLISFRRLWNEWRKNNLIHLYWIKYEKAKKSITYLLYSNIGEPIASRNFQLIIWRKIKDQKKLLLQCSFIDIKCNREWKKSIIRHVELCRNMFVSFNQIQFIDFYRLFNKHRVNQSISTGLDIKKRKKINILTFSKKTKQLLTNWPGSKLSRIFFPISS